jgi:cytochrome c-type biogenesis protein CcsB
VNETLAQVSDLAFEAALAGYVVALVCYTVELASRRVSVPAGVDRSAGGGTIVATGDGDIGRIAAREPVSWGERFGRAAVAVTVVGVVANVVSIVARGLAVGRLPLGNMYEFTSAICALAVIAWLVVLARTGARTLGVFVLLPVVLLAFLAGTVLYTPAAPVVPALNSYWKWIHVTTVAASSSVLLVSGAASALYLTRGRAERRRAATVAARQDHEETPSAPEAAGTRSVLSRLPSLSVLDRIGYRTAIIAFPVYTFAVIAGAMWAEVAWGRYWGWDPKETCAFVTWVIYAAYLHARSTAGWRGRPAAWISVLGLVSILFNLFVINMVVSGLHSYAGLN